MAFTTSLGLLSAGQAVLENANRHAHAEHAADYLVGMLEPFVGFVVRGDRAAIVFLPPPGEPKPKVVTFTLCPKKLQALRKVRQ